MKKLKFETKDVGGEKLELEVRLPTAAEKAKARTIHAKVWRDSSNAGVMVRDELDSFLKGRGLWGDEQQKLYDDLGKEIRDKVVSLQKGGNSGLTKKTGRALALDVASLRVKRNEIISKRNSVDNHTAESIADQAQFNYLVASCTLRTDGIFAGKVYFPSYEFFLENSDTDAAYEASVKFYELQNSQGTDKTEEVEDLPEIKFLKTHGLADEKGRLIDDQGRLVDEDYRLINEDGRFINDSGEFVNIDGVLITSSGDPIVEYAPLLDDES